MIRKDKTHLHLFKHQLLITIISVFAVVVAMIGGSYAFFSSTSKADEYNVLKVGELEISYVDQGEGYGDVLSLNGAYPMSIDDAKQITPYRFNVVNTGTLAADFKIKIKNDEAIIAEDHCEKNLLDDQYIMYQFDHEEPVLLSSKASEDYTIYSSQNLIADPDGEENGLLKNSSEIHEIRIWIKEDAPNEILGKHFHGKVVIESVQSGVQETKEFHIGDAVTLKDGSKWRVLEDSDETSTTVTLLSDYNLKEDGSYHTDCTGVCSPKAFDESDSRLTDPNSYCLTPEFGCNYYGQNGSTVVKDSTIKTWLEDVYLSKLKTSLSEKGGNTEDLTVSLPTMEQLASASNQKFDQKVLDFTSYDWLVSTSYWTRTRSNSGSSYVWGVFSTNHNSFIQYANSINTNGVRPVIVVKKENIQ